MSVGFEGQVPKPTFNRVGHLFYCAHEEGVGPTTLSRLTGISYSVVQRATSAVNEKLKRLKGHVAELSEDE